MNSNVADASSHPRTVALAPIATPFATGRATWYPNPKIKNPTKPSSTKTPNIARRLTTKNGTETVFFAGFLSS